MGQRPSQCWACGSFTFCLSPSDPLCDERADRVNEEAAWALDND